MPLKVKFITFIIAIFIMSQFLNIGNYSFFSYTFSGAKYYSPLTQLSKAARIPLLLFGFALFSFVSNKVFTGYIDFLKKNWDILLYLFFTLFSFTNIVSLYNGLLYTFWYALCLFFLLLVIYLVSFKTTKKVASVRLLELVFYSNAVLIPMALVSLVTLEPKAKLALAFGNKSFFSNPLAGIFVAVCCFIIAKQKEQLKKISTLRFFSKISLFILSGFLIYILAKTGRRTPFIISILVIPITFYFTFAKNIFAKILLLVLIPTALIFVSIKIDSLIEQYASENITFRRLQKINIGEGGEIEESSWQDRILIWNSYYVVHKKYPVFGTGLGNALIQQEKVLSGVYPSGLSTHNTYFSILVEQGLVGIFFFIIILTRSIYLALFKGNSYFKIAFFLLLFQSSVLNFTETNYSPGQAYFWITYLVWFMPRIFLNKSLLK